MQASHICFGFCTDCRGSKKGFNQCVLTRQPLINGDVSAWPNIKSELRFPRPRQEKRAVTVTRLHSATAEAQRRRLRVVLRCMSRRRDTEGTRCCSRSIRSRLGEGRCHKQCTKYRRNTRSNAPQTGTVGSTAPTRVAAFFFRKKRRKKLGKNSRVHQSRAAQVVPITKSPSAKMLNLLSQRSAWRIREIT